MKALDSVSFKKEFSSTFVVSVVLLSGLLLKFLFKGTSSEDLIICSCINKPRKTVWSQIDCQVSDCLILAIRICCLLCNILLQGLVAPNNSTYYLTVFMSQDCGHNVAGLSGSGSLMTLQSRWQLGLQSHLRVSLGRGPAPVLMFVFVGRPQFLLGCCTAGLCFSTWASP